MSFQNQVELYYSECLKGTSSPAETAFRERAWQAFVKQGLPDRSNEAWKYSTLGALTQKNWTAATSLANAPVLALDLVREFKADFDIALMVNGELQPQHSLLTLEAGYEFKRRSFTSGRGTLNYDDGFLSAAAAVNRGGYELTIAPGLEIKRPLLIVHCHQGEGSWSSTINRIAVGKGARFSLAEVFIGAGSSYLRTDITQLEVADGGHLNWVRAQQESELASSFAEVQGHLRAQSGLSLTQVNCGAAWSRNSLKIDIHGEGAEAQINGLSFGRGQQHVDQRVQVSHHAPHTTSAQLFKGVLKDGARGVLNGKIYIAKHAQKVASSQLNHSLLLGSGAEADTKPELEIYADDVKANHGASVGRMDEGKLFYFLSRGITRERAQQMLAQAFVSDVMMKIPSPVLRDFVTARVEGLLPGFLADVAAGVNS